MKSLNDMSDEEKIEMLDFLATSEERFFSNYSDKLNFFAKDTNPEVRAKAISCMWDFPSKDRIDLLFEALRTETDPEIRVKVISGLGRYVFELEDDELFGDDEMFDKFASEEDRIPRDDLIRVKQYLVETFKDESRSIDERRHALEGLGFSSDESVQHMIEEAYSSGDKSMRVSAIFAMGRSGLLIWHKTLVKELDNPDPEIQLEAIRACGSAGVEKAGKRLLQLTHSRDKDIFLASVWALGETGWKDGFDRLDELSSSKDEEVSETAKAALEEWFVTNGDAQDFDV